MICTSTELKITYQDNSTNSVTWTKPYQHPAVAATLQQAFFSSSTDIGLTQTAIFTSSVADRPNEPEIPMHMLALTATAVFYFFIRRNYFPCLTTSYASQIHAALMNRRLAFSGKTIDFSANNFSDAYNEHLLILTNIQTKKLRAYHKLMHDLYQTARYVIPSPCSTRATYSSFRSGNVSAGATAGAKPTTALDHIDIDNMDVD